MCGIVGIYDPSRSHLVDHEVLIRMRDTMVHRGPDGAGCWYSTDGFTALAHRRLSIVDLSSSATQPMPNEDQTIWVTYNGEIYNHAQLRRELTAHGHLFRTDHSDTEIIVHGYEQWGIDGLVQRIEGDYAIGLWDDRKRNLHLIRDRIGVKPLYFALPQGQVIFASEIKALLEHPAIGRDIDPIAMYHYLSFLTTPSPLTMFRGIFKLPPGVYATVDGDGGFTAERYWDATPGRSNLDRELRGLSASAQEELLVDGIRSRLLASVEKRLMADVPVGVFLSGGIDSSTNVAMMAQSSSRPVETFSVGFKDHTHLNELEYAARVAKTFRTNHHEILIDEGDMRGYLSDLIHHQDEPIADWVCIPLYFVSQLARSHGVTVVQVGEGSDEQFSGYSSYMGYLKLYSKYWTPYRRYVPTALQTAVASIAKRASSAFPRAEVYADILDRAARNREHFWSGATVFWDTLKSQLVQDSLVSSTNGYEELINSGLLPRSFLEVDSFNVIKSFNERLEAAHPDHDILTRMVFNEFQLRLPELLLMRVDKIGMSVSLEPRVPFLDHNLVEYTMDIPMNHKVKGNTAKYLLKKAVEDLIPQDIIYRKKMGFGAPMGLWLRGDFGRYAQERVFQSRLLDRGFFRREYIQRLFSDHFTNRRDNSLYIWTIFNLTAWYDYWIDRRVH
jgi:asparagine synthase (glutamine-hydrolysing)